MDLRRFSDNVKNEYESNYGIDPFTILTIISLVFQIAKWIYECRTKNGKDLLEISRKRPTIEVIALRRKLRQLYPGSDNQDKRRFLCDAILSATSGLNEEQITKLILEAQNELSDATPVQ